MIKIRVKILILFFAVVLFFAINSLFVVFFIDKLSKKVYETMALKEAIDDIVLHSSNIQNVLILYVTADAEKLPALKSEYDSFMDHSHHAIKTLETRPDFANYLSVIDKMHAKNMEMEEKMMKIKKEQLEQEDNYSSIIKNLKEKRHRVIDDTRIGSAKLKLDIAQMGYKDKEFNFQYQDKTHAVEWIESIETVKSGLEKEGFAGDLPFADDYLNLAREAIAAREAIKDFEANGRYYLDLTKNNLLEVDIAAFRLTQIIGREMDNLLAEAGNQRRISFGVIIFSFIIGSFVIFRFSRSITLSIDKFMEVVQKISEGDLKERADVKSDDEMARLSAIFNQTLDNIEESHKKLNDINRKLMVSEWQLRESNQQFKKTAQSLEEEKASLQIRVLARTREIEESKADLEAIVAQRTKDLNEKLAELERFKELTEGREERIIELKNKIEDMEERLRNGGGGRERRPYKFLN